MERNDLNPVLSLLDPHFTPLEREKKKRESFRERPFLPSKFRFPISTRTARVQEGRGGEGKRVDKKKPRKRRGVEESGRRRKREGKRGREGGGWRLACPRSFTAIPRTHVPVYEWIGTEGGDGRSWKWRRTDFPSSRTRDLSPVRSTPPSPPRLNETRWDRRADERTRPHGSLYKEGKEQNLFPRLVLERGDKINLGGIR